MGQKVDLLTGEKFTPKRTNQQFATPQNRIRYHNKKLITIRKAMAKVDKPLHRNYYILSELLKGKKEEIFHYEFLRGKGFDFAVHTHIDQIGNKQHYAVYNYIILRLDDQKVKIIKNEC